MVIAIDPGCERSALVVVHDGRLDHMMLAPNDEILEWLEDSRSLDDICGTPLVIEKIINYGGGFGETLSMTCLWSGRFMQAYGPELTTLIPRKTVVSHICGTSKGGDSIVRMALIDRYGGKEKAIGTKKEPGPLYGVKKDLFSALALGITWEETVGKVVSN